MNDWKSVDPRVDPDVYLWDLSIEPWRSGWTAPQSQDGDRCPWPWEPQIQQNSGQWYRCGYCHSEVISGQTHLDYSTDPPS